MQFSVQALEANNKAKECLVVFTSQAQQTGDSTDQGLTDLISGFFKQKDFAGKNRRNIAYSQTSRP